MLDTIARSDKTREFTRESLKADIEQRYGKVYKESDLNRSLNAAVEAKLVEKVSEDEYKAKKEARIPMQLFA